MNRRRVAQVAVAALVATPLVGLVGGAPANAAGRTSPYIVVMKADPLVRSVAPVEMQRTLQSRPTIAAITRRTPKLLEAKRAVMDGRRPW